MSVKPFSLIIGIITVICSELSGIEIINATASSEDGVLTVSWQVYNDCDEPIYLLNINEPLIEKTQDNLLVFFRMPDLTALRRMREVPFLSRVKRIEGDSTYTFNFRIDPSRQFDVLDLDPHRYFMMGNIDELARVIVFLGYTDEDISYVYDEDDELGLKGVEVFNVKTDDGFQHISTFTQEQIMAMNRERFVSVIDVQQVMYFIVSLERVSKFFISNEALNTIDFIVLEMVIVGSDSFKTKVLEDMQKLTRDALDIRSDGTIIITKVDNTTGNRDAGTELIRRMNTKYNGTGREKDKHIITIVKTAGENEWISDNPIASGIGIGTSGTIRYNPSSDPLIRTRDPKSGHEVRIRRPPQIGLAHELIHADHAREGTIEGELNASGKPQHKLGTHTYIDSFGILRTIDYYPIDEIRTVGLGYNLPGDVTENQIRKEHNLNERL